MRKTRSYRFAPEFLERKLSLSAAAATLCRPGARHVNYDGPPSPSPDPTDPTSPTDPTDPTTPPGNPGGPSGPCVTM